MEPLKDQPVERISMRMIGGYLLKVANIEKGLPFTLWQLVARPGKAIQEFLCTSRRKKYMKPVPFILLLSVTGTWLTFLFMEKYLMAKGSMFGFDLTDYNENQRLIINHVYHLLEKYHHLMQLMLVPLLALASKWVFKDRKFNIAEYLVIHAYLMGVMISLSILGIGLTIVFKSASPTIFSSLLQFLFLAYAYYFIFQQKNGFYSILKTLGAYYLAHFFYVIFQVMIVAASIIKNDLLGTILNL